MKMAKVYEKGEIDSAKKQESIGLLATIAIEEHRKRG